MKNARSYFEQGIKTGKIELPQGDFFLSKPIDLGEIDGFKLSGQGKLTNKRPNGKQKNYTRLFLKESDRPAITASLRNFTIENIALVGGTFNLDAERGIGVGHGVLNSVSQIDCRFLMGDKEYNGNAADVTWYSCRFYGNEKPLVENLTSQNINYRFYDPFIANCQSWFKVGGGGKISLRDGYCINTNILFHVTGPGHVFGNQNDQIRIDCLDYDQRQSRLPILVLDTGYYGQNRDLTAKNVVFSPGKPGILVKRDSDTSWNIHQERCQRVFKEEFVISQ